MISRGDVRWHQGVVCLRALIEVAGWAHEGVLGARAGHPWAGALSELRETARRADRFCRRATATQLNAAAPDNNAPVSRTRGDC